MHREPVAFSYRPQAGRRAVWWGIPLSMAFAIGGVSPEVDAHPSSPADVKVELCRVPVQSLSFRES